MHVPALLRPSTELSRHLRSHHAISGLGCALGVLLLTLLTYPLLGARAAIAVSAGALVVSVADLPLPGRNKLPLLLANLLQAPLVTALIEQTHPYPVALGAAVLLISFASAMVTAWGRFSLPLGYGMVLVMAFSMARPDMTPHELLIHLGLQACGGVLYIGYAMLLARLLDMPMRRRALADALYGFSDYLRYKADVFDTAQPLDKVYANLVRQQSRFAEKLQTARDFVLDERRTPQQDALAAGMFALMDVHEDVLSSQADYEVLRAHFGEHPVMQQLAAMTKSSADDVARVADSGLRAGAS
ncbi:MAG TPA: FUSC family membrane protein, partial [Methyloversatilis sp.]